MNDILFAKVNENGIIPTKEEYNAGYDLYCCFDDDFITIAPHTTELVPTGIASVIPIDFYIHICERGSTGSKGIKSSAGVIDSSYRGEWFMAVTNTNNKPLAIVKEEYLNNHKDEFDGYVVYPYEKALFQGIVHSVHNELSTKEITYDELLTHKSERGSGKLGSSGK